MQTTPSNMMRMMVWSYFIFCLCEICINIWVINLMNSLVWKKKLWFCSFLLVFGEHLVKNVSQKAQKVGRILLPPGGNDEKLQAFRRCMIEHWHPVSLVSRRHDRLECLDFTRWNFLNPFVENWDSRNTSLHRSQYSSVAVRLIYCGFFFFTSDTFLL